MLAGNKDSLAFEALPLSPTWERRYAPERAGWAGLAIWAGGQNLCRHVMPGSDHVDDLLNVPLGPVADWLVRSLGAIEMEERAALFTTLRDAHESLRAWGDRRPVGGVSEDGWLDAREAWWARHFLAAGSDGAQLPNLALVRDDEQLALSWAPPRFAGAPAPQMLSARGIWSVPWREARETIGRFVAAVAASLRDAEAPDAWPWVGSPDPIAQARLGIEQAVLLFTGRTREELLALTESTDTAQLLAQLGLSARSVDPAEGPVPQALRDLPPRLPAEFGGPLRELERRTRLPHDLRSWAGSRELLADAMASASTPEEAGQLAAGVLREHLGFGADPIPEVARVLAGLGVELLDSEVRATFERMLAGARAEGSAVAIILATPRTATDWGRRFEAIRALGHLLLDKLRGTAVGAAGSRYTTETRRRRSGAFAAEFLLPREALEKESGGAVDAAADPAVFTRILEHYGVGARTAAHQLWNRGWLSATAVRDELIDLHARG